MEYENKVLNNYQDMSLRSGLRFMMNQTEHTMLIKTSDLKHRNLDLIYVIGMMLILL